MKRSLFGLWFDYTFVTVVRILNKALLAVYSVRLFSKTPAILLYIDADANKELADLKRQIYKRIHGNRI